ncbi:Probable magnesium transporter NIPA3 [Linum perenne]
MLSFRAISTSNLKGLVLALSSSLFIGSSFIIKKKGLKKASASGLRAGAGGYSYLYEPLWWIGMTTSSTIIVLHAPQERQIHSVIEVFQLATEPVSLLYAGFVLVAVFILIVHVVPRYGQTHVMVYIAICSLIGSLSVMSVKALGIALKLTFLGMNQLIYPQTWAFTLVVITCVIIQMNFLNKALDTFNTAVVSPIYYVMFTTFTILASVIMFKDWDRQNPIQIVTEICGFVTILAGTFLLHKTKDMAECSTSPLPLRLVNHEGTPLRQQEHFMV